jgi:hypothetical protein
LSFNSDILAFSALSLFWQLFEKLGDFLEKASGRSA